MLLSTTFWLYLIHSCFSVMMFGVFSPLRLRRHAVCPWASTSRVNSWMWNWWIKGHVNFKFIWMLSFYVVIGTNMAQSLTRWGKGKRLFTGSWESCIVLVGSTLRCYCCMEVQVWIKWWLWSGHGIDWGKYCRSALSTSVPSSFYFGEAETLRSDSGLPCS